MTTENTRLPFGKHKGKRLRDCPPSYLTWMGENLIDSDFHEFALLARDIAEKHQSEQQEAAALEEAGDEFLRKHGIDPKKFK
jgi:hypothetical protein